MAIEWGPQTKAAAERQAAAIRAAATESRHHKLADRAASGEFTDYADTHARNDRRERRVGKIRERTGHRS